MRFDPIGDCGAYRVYPPVRRDDRGSFQRTWCAVAFEEFGITFKAVQGNSSLTKFRGIVRGMHFQRAPREDAKVIRCSRGRIHDVIVDLRADSGTRGHVYVNELDGDEGTMLFVPAGFAHGFQTLSDNTVVEYLMGESYVPELYDGFRYDDEAVGISWPEPVRGISENDLRWSSLAERFPWFRAEGA
ncbi:dTDP-4-keto-6-deoxy-D-glucose epimerase [Microvirga tunisiensis]|uniref:dTDP-4-dehydrorhamnose 3,5-epimerase n=2 Tax=Microvirga tunisiensis TaxID=2108360 RepID=A0A5N7N2S0_9HYPH|nr:dTDP-4-dehydrorhamnose 3,5-epimerase [Microvirga tunisiensis]MPR12096.1 dTDP-4-keto-6-deoxy-D-glucose epimerase [Microvirga tunisiensis]MPR30036.1 dTDP-4-keto-6-deoxy-D-glucose epimerase [Microvirga tunisiensis]